MYFLKKHILGNNKNENSMQSFNKGIKVANVESLVFAGRTTVQYANTIYDELCLINNILYMGLYVYNYMKCSWIVFSKLINRK